jgi:primase-polymerase (primpol)-like protein
MALKRWVRHQDKRPMHPQGFWMSVTNPEHWSTYQAAKASRYGQGLGFVLNGDGIVCIDLDHCITDGVLSQEAQALLDSLPETYSETSPSGTGVHIWGYASMTAGKRFTRNGLSVEIYPAGRYITMTGKAITRAPLAQLPIATLLTD